MELRDRLPVGLAPDHLRAVLAPPRVHGVVVQQVKV